VRDLVDDIFYGVPPARQLEGRMVLYEQIPEKARVSKIVSVDGFETFKGVIVTLDDGTTAHANSIMGHVKVGEYWVVKESGFVYCMSQNQLDSSYRRIQE
jgi:hypothetical protein